MVMFQEKRAERRAPVKRKATAPKTNGHAKYVLSNQGEVWC